LLLLNILPDDLNRRTATAPRKITGRPERTAPEFLFDRRVILFRIIRLETPFKLFTNADTDTLGG
jgi:hypothetical protein